MSESGSNKPFTGAPGAAGSRAATPTAVWVCGECEHGAPPDLWGIATDEETGQPNNDTAVCPHCGFEHHDDDGSFVDEVIL